ncbi:MAG: hypothetical protein Q8K75_02820 [Chlamydiales bacterium]|nr:hypothetical protein [Chlamydiales bacterium]
MESDVLVDIKRVLAETVNAQGDAPAQLSAEVTRVCKDHHLDSSQTDRVVQACLQMFQQKIAAPSRPPSPMMAQAKGAGKNLDLKLQGQKVKAAAALNRLPNTMALALASDEAERQGAIKELRSDLQKLCDYLPGGAGHAMSCMETELVKIATALTTSGISADAINVVKEAVVDVLKEAKEKHGATMQRALLDATNFAINRAGEGPIAQTLEDLQIGVGLQDARSERLTNMIQEYHATGTPEQGLKEICALFSEMVNDARQDTRLVFEIIQQAATAQYFEVGYCRKGDELLYALGTQLLGICQQKGTEDLWWDLATYHEMCSYDQQEDKPPLMEGIKMIWGAMEMEMPKPAVTSAQSEIHPVIFHASPHYARDLMSNYPTLSTQVVLEMGLRKLGEVHGDQPVHPIFVGEEWKFYASSKQELVNILDDLGALSQQYPNVLIIPGTIAWTEPDPENPSMLRAFNSMPVFEGGRLVHLYHKTHERSDLDTIRSVIASKGIDLAPGNPRWAMSDEETKESLSRFNSNVFVHDGLAVSLEVCCDHGNMAAQQDYNRRYPGSVGTDLHILPSHGTVPTIQRTPVATGGTMLSLDHANIAKSKVGTARDDGDTRIWAVTDTQDNNSDHQVSAQRSHITSAEGAPRLAPRTIDFPGQVSPADADRTKAFFKVISEETGVSATWLRMEITNLLEANKSDFYPSSRTTLKDGSLSGVMENLHKRYAFPSRDALEQSIEALKKGEDDPALFPLLPQLMSQRLGRDIVVQTDLATAPRTIVSPDWARPTEPAKGAIEIIQSYSLGTFVKSDQVKVVKPSAPLTSSKPMVSSALLAISIPTPSAINGVRNTIVQNLRSSHDEAFLDEADALCTALKKKADGYKWAAKISPKRRAIIRNLNQAVKTIRAEIQEASLQLLEDKLSRKRANPNMALSLKALTGFGTKELKGRHLKVESGYLVLSKGRKGLDLDATFGAIQQLSNSLFPAEQAPSSNVSVKVFSKELKKVSKAYGGVRGRLSPSQRKFRKQLRIELNRLEELSSRTT